MDDAVCFVFDSTLLLLLFSCFVFSLLCYPKLRIEQFLAHEVRNPIAAALTAHGFATSEVSRIQTIVNKSNDWSFLPALQDDIKIIGCSLYFIDDFLKCILDFHASNDKKLVLNLAPTNILRDVLEPVRSMLYQRDGQTKVTVDCPANIVVETDALRLKQVCEEKECCQAIAIACLR